MKTTNPVKIAFALRLATQWLFLGWCLFLGVQFGLFVAHFESMGERAYYPRPPGVEGFLPIGALVSLKNLVFNGAIDPVHPAALVLFVTFLAMALLARKSFCSFLCPVGTLSEGGWKLGQKMFGRNFRIWPWLDRLLCSLKYLLLIFFVKLILFDMSAVAAKGFLQSPYWAIADVKMLHFFTGPSLTSLLVIGGLVLFSLPYRNVWCRYLCPYGALLGLLSLASPVKVRRSEDHCIDCGACSRVCPALIDVRHKVRVDSTNCTACMTCLCNCPKEKALDLDLCGHRLPAGLFVGLVLLLFAGGVSFGMVSGNWQTVLSYQDYQRLIPLAERLGH
ncbi:MAG: 4Fe-4S binding protein [Desulfuromonas sp.]|nr:MAG: 4Fe-4S binding protein [Desulfuromonas sp.]